MIYRGAVREEVCKYHIAKSSRSGNVGSSVARTLIARNITCRAIVRDPDEAQRKLPDFADSGLCSFVQGDLNGTVPRRELFDGVEGLFLMRPPQIGDVKRLMFPFLRTAREAQVSRVVFLSLLGANMIPFIPHRTLEKEIARLGFNFAFLRAGFFMQNLDGLFRDFIRDDAEIPAPAKQSRTSFVDARDLGEAAASLLSDKSPRCGAFPLTGTEAITYAEVARRLTSILGKRVEYTCPSTKTFRRRALEKGWDPTYVTIVARLFITVRLGLASKTTDELGDLLERVPTTLDRYIKDYCSIWT